eukprot:gene5853-9681_t
MSFINIDSLLNNIRLINKRHDQITFSPFTWKLKGGLLESVPENTFTYLIQKVGCFWKEISLENDAPSAFMLQHIASNCTNLNDLRIRFHNNTFTLSNIQSLLLKTNKLKSLNLFQILFSDKQITTKKTTINLKYLKNLNLKLEESIDLLKLISAPNLEIMNLICTDFTDVSSGIIASKFSKNLKEITISTLNSKSTDEGMKKIFESFSTKMKSISLNSEFISPNRADFTFKTMKFISKNENLEVLNLKNPNSWMNGNSKTVKIYKMKKLKNLQITEDSVEFFDNIGAIEEILNNSQFIESLVLNIKFKSSLFFKPNFFKNLKIIELIGSVDSDDQIKTLVENAKNLEEISIGIMDKDEPIILENITDKSVKSISNLKNLKDLKLFNCNISNQSLIYLTERKVPKEKLLIFGSPKIENKLIENLKNSNLNLKKLCLGKVNLKSLNHIQRYFPNLIHLEIHSFQSFESDVFVSISKLKLLQKLLFKSTIQKKNFKSDIILNLKTIGLFKLSLDQLLTVIASCPNVEFIQIDKNFSNFKTEIKKLIKEQMNLIDQFRFINNLCEKKVEIPTEVLIEKFRFLISNNILSKEKHNEIFQDISFILKNVNQKFNMTQKKSYFFILNLFFKFYYSNFFIQIICHEMINLTKKLQNFVKNESWEE